MSEENLVDIFTPDDPKITTKDEYCEKKDPLVQRTDTEYFLGDLVTATVETNKENGYVSHVHIDINKPDKYHLTSEYPDKWTPKNSVRVPEDTFNESEDATLTPTGSKVDINIHEIDIPEYKSDLMKNLLYDITCDYANTVKNTIYASIPPMVNIAYPIVEWYQHITGKTDYELAFPVKFCLDEIAKHYEELEKEYDEFKRSVTTDKKLRDMKERKLEKELKSWKIFGNCAIAVMFALMGYMIYTIF